MSFNCFYDFCTLWAVLFLYFFGCPVAVKVCAHLHSTGGMGVELNSSWDIWELEQFNWRHKRNYRGYLLSSIILNIWKVQANYILHYNKIRAECAGTSCGRQRRLSKEFYLLCCDFLSTYISSSSLLSWAGPPDSSQDIGWGGRSGHVSDVWQNLEWWVDTILGEYFHTIKTLF